MLALSLAAAASWTLLINDEPRGSVHYDAASIERVGELRRIETRHSYMAPQSDGTATVFSRLELDCSDSTWVVRRAVGRDIEGAQTFAYSYPEARPAPPSARSRVWHLFDVACGRRRR